MEHEKRGYEQEPSSNDIPRWRRWWRRTGWPGKTLWDWQALLFIPVTIALIASLFTQYQNDRQRDIENLRTEQTVTQAYLEYIGTLLLDEDLSVEDENSDVRLLARARTLAVLDGVSGDRKVRVLEFLSETELIQFGPGGQPPVISLRFADLREARLVSRSILSNTDLDRAELIDARLIRSNLSNSRLPKADLSGADLSGADLSGADLSGADLDGAKGVNCQQTARAESLEDATMPDGQRYEEWLEGKEGC